MAAVKMTFSLEPAVAEILKHRAAELGKPASRYLSELIQADAQRAQDHVAEEGYRLLSADTGTFAEAALPLANETWPEWEPAGHA